MPPENLRELVLSQHVIVGGGGNTAIMLAYLARPRIRHAPA
jgi:hypothetical protein